MADNVSVSNASIRENGFTMTFKEREIIQQSGDSLVGLGKLPSSAEERLLLGAQHSLLLRPCALSAQFCGSLAISL